MRAPPVVLSIIPERMHQSAPLMPLTKGQRPVRKVAAADRRAQLCRAVVSKFRIPARPAYRSRLHPGPKRLGQRAIM